MKGSVFDSIGLTIEIFILIFGVFLAFFIVSNISDAMLEDPNINTTMNMTYLQEARDSINLFDYAGIVILAGYILVLFFSAYMTQTSPIFYPISIMIVFIVLVISAIFSHIYIELASTSQFADTTATFTLTTAIMTNLPFIIGVISMIFYIILYAKTRAEGGVSI